MKSADNAADRSSRLDSTPSELGLESGWQRGPDYLTKDREHWPLDRSFADRKNKVHIPKEEIIKKYRGLSDSCGHINLHDLVDHRGEKVSVLGNMFIGDKELHILGKIIGGPGSKENDVLKFFGQGYITNDWDKLIRKISLLFRWRHKVESK